MAKRRKFHPIEKLPGMTPHILWDFMFKSCIKAVFDRQLFTSASVVYSNNNYSMEYACISDLMDHLCREGFVCSRKLTTGVYRVTEKWFHEAENFCQCPDYFLDQSTTWPFTGCFPHDSGSKCKLTLAAECRVMFPGFKKLLLAAGTRVCVKSRYETLGRGTIKTVAARLKDEQTLANLTGDTPPVINEVILTGKEVTKAWEALLPERLRRYRYAQELPSAVASLEIPGIDPEVKQAARKALRTSERRYETLCEGVASLSMGVPRRKLTTMLTRTRIHEENYNRRLKRRIAAILRTLAETRLELENNETVIQLLGQAAAVPPETLEAYLEEQIHRDIEHFTRKEKQ